MRIRKLQNFSPILAWINKTYLLFAITQPSACSAGSTLTDIRYRQLDKSKCIIFTWELKYWQEKLQ